MNPNEDNNPTFDVGVSIAEYFENIESTIENSPQVIHSAEDSCGTWREKESD